jgi:hypothetical protein
MEDTDKKEFREPHYSWVARALSHLRKDDSEVPVLKQ